MGTDTEQYLLFQLYFDNVRLDNVEDAPQQLCLALHFPFHMALVVLVEGINQVFRFSHVMDDYITQINDLERRLEPSETSDQIVNAINGTLVFVNDHFLTGENDGEYEQWQNTLESMRSDANITLDEILENLSDILVKVTKAVFEAFEVELPNSEAEEELSGSASQRLTETLGQYENLFNLTFGRSTPQQLRLFWFDFRMLAPLTKVQRTSALAAALS